MFGGRHGDIPLEPTAGAVLADFVLRERLSCVLDVSEMSRAETRRFLLAFAERLYRQADADPLHLFLEEAHEYLPQMVRGGDAPLVGAWQRIVKQGRFKGLGVTLVSQRSASLNKDVLTQCDTLIVLRTTSPQDRKAVRDWVDVHADSAAMLDTLPSLQNGEAWVWSPEIGGELDRVKFRQRRTFDSGATPKVGAKPRPPATLADVDLGAIKEQMTETIERAKLDDPRELRARIKQLENEKETVLRSLDEARAAAPETVVERVEVPVLDESLVVRLEGALSPFAALLGEIQERLTWEVTQRGEVESYERRLHGARGAGNGARVVASGSNGGTTPNASTPGGGAVAQEIIVRPAERADRASRRDASGAPVSGAETTRPVKAGARRMLQALASRTPTSLTRVQLGLLADLSHSSGTFGDYLSALRTNRFIFENGESIGISREGLDFLGGDVPRPLRSDEVIALWRSKLKAGAKRMLDFLVSTYPEWCDRDTLADAVDMAQSGTFGDYLSKLRTNDMIEESGRSLRASSMLFPDD